MLGDLDLRSHLVGSVASPGRLATLVDLLRYRASVSPDRIGYRFLDHGGREIDSLTYGQLDRSARRIAAALDGRIEPGGRAILLYRPGLEFIRGLFGCLYAGGIAVPCYPPGSSQSTRRRIQAIAADAVPDVVLTDAATLALSVQARADPDLSAAHWIVSDDLPGSSVTPAVRDAAADTIAILQYSSGSTSAPRGVMLSHSNVLANQQMICAAFGHDEDTVVVSWLPVQHDMGLIGAVLQPLYVGAPCVLMSPATFLRSPLRWLEAISRYGATTSGAPNFAYDLCARRITEAERTGLDLSRWKVAFNGSEPVRHATLAAFAEAFAPCGFRPASFMPCYGLAEATLLVSAGPANSGPVAQNRDHNLAAVVGCGIVAQNLAVRIVDPETLQERGCGEVGEIWIAGPSVAHGYWNRAPKTADTFHRGVAGEAGTAYLRTGDLGFLNDGQLFVTGRRSDVIVWRGRNLHPQDLEASLEQHDREADRGTCVVFAVTVGDCERLVVVQEATPTAAARGAKLVERIQRVLAAEHGVTADEINLVQPRSIPRTTSGKLQRAACRLLWQRGELNPIHRHAAAPVRPAKRLLEPSLLEAMSAETRAATLARHLRDRAAALLGVEASVIDPGRALATYGVDSIASLILLGEIETDLGICLQPRPQGRLPSIDRICTIALAAFDRRTAGPDAPAAGNSNAFPLSIGQRALWFESRLATRPDLLNVAVAARLGAGVPVAAIRWILRRLAEQHASLRTVIVEREDSTQQSVAAQGTIAVMEVEAGDWTDRQLAEDLAAQVNCPFLLSGGPLARACLYRERDGRTVVLLVTHHVICDLRSLEILLVDFSRLYESWRSGALLPLPPQRESYRAYVDLQRKLLDSAQAKESSAYWQRRLEGCERLALRGDRQRPPRATHRGDRVAFAFGNDRSERVDRTARSHGTTPFGVLISIFAILLARQSEQSDIAIGSPMIGRPDGRFSDVVGLFVNAVIIRNEIDPREPFTDLLARTEHRIAEAMIHQWIPFSSVVEALNPPRQPDSRPLCSVMFAFQQIWDADLRDLSSFALGHRCAPIGLGALQLEPVPIERGIAMFDLTLTIARVGDEYRCNMEYDCDMFDRTTIQNLASRYTDLAARFCADPTLPVGASLPLRGDEKRALLQGERVEAGAVGDAVCLHDRFRYWAGATPDAPAVLSSSGCLTYGQLQMRADGLARILRTRGIVPGSRVAFCLVPSERVVIAILGILLAGAAYVPVDPGDPADRRAFVLEDSGSELVITEAGTAISDVAVQLLDYDLLEGEIARGGWPGVPDLSPQSAAYLIFTSGSTGAPKGTIISHANVDRLFAATSRSFHFGPSDTWVMFHSPAFDFSVWEIWGALRHGGRLVVLPYEVTRSASDLCDWLLRHGVTVLNQTPSAFRQLARVIAGVPRADLRLRYVILGGEPVDFGALHDWMDSLGDEQPTIITMYGITETTVHLTYRRLRRRDLDYTASPIGEPIAGMKLYLLDDDLQPVPAGFAGEIYVAGPNLGTGYHNRSALTACRFIPDPYASEPGQRLYRTGDRAVRRHDGELAFCGRSDSQVKVRGFRVELREIEVALQRHPAVARAIVLHQAVSPGRNEIVAFIVGTRQPGIEAVLRDHARTLLPAQMLPGSFAWIDSVPLTRNGKLDRQALATVKRYYPTSPAPRAAPASDLERQLLELWSELLGADEIGIDDSFFDLGGHSLLLEKMALRVRGLVGREVPLVEFYGQPTIRALASFLAGQQQTTPSTSHARRARDRILRIELQWHRRAAGPILDSEELPP